MPWCSKLRKSLSSFIFKNWRYSCKERFKPEQGLSGHNFWPIKTGFAVQGANTSIRLASISDSEPCRVFLTLFRDFLNDGTFTSGGSFDAPFTLVKISFFPIFFTNFRVMGLPSSIDYSKFHIFSISDPPFFRSWKKTPEFSSDGSFAHPNKGEMGLIEGHLRSLVAIPPSKY